MGNVQEVFETRDFPPLDVQLLRAAEYGDVDHLQQLLDRHKNGEDFNIDVTSNYLWTPLFMAAKQGHADCVQLLLEAGEKFSALHFAFACNECEQREFVMHNVANAKYTFLYFFTASVHRPPWKKIKNYTLHSLSV